MPSVIIANILYVFIIINCQLSIINCSSEPIVEVQHEVDALCVELLGVLLEVVRAVHRVGAVLGLLVGVVGASALLVTARAQFAVVGDVGHHQVHVQRVVGDAEGVADGAVEHESALALCLCGHIVVCVVDGKSGSSHVLGVAHVGRVTEVDAVVVVAVQVEVPSLYAVSESQAGGGQWGAALTHSLVVAEVCALDAFVREQIGYVGVLGVLGLCDRPQQVDGEVAGDLELHAQFSAVVVLLHACEAIVGEGILVVVVEVLPFRSAVCVRKVGRQVQLHQFVVQCVADFRGQYFLVLQVLHEVVALLGADECHVGVWGVCFVANAHGDGVAAAQVQVGAHLEAAVQKACLLALSVTEADVFSCVVEKFQTN